MHLLLKAPQLTLALLLLNIHPTSLASAEDLACPRSAEYTIFLKGENRINPEDIAFREKIEALSHENTIHYCVEGTTPEDYLTAAYDPFIESPSAEMLRTPQGLEDPLVFLLSHLFTYRDLALHETMHQKELGATAEAEREELEAGLNYHDFRKNLGSVEI